MRLAYPAYSFFFLIAAAAIVVYYIAWRRKKGKIDRFLRGPAAAKLIDGTIYHRQVYKIVLVTAALFLTVIALIGPQIGMRLSEIRRRGIDVIIGIDCSKSMLAEDYFPNRLGMAKNELASFIEKLEGDRIGIVAFAGQAFVQCPLTLDYSAAKMFLSLIDTSLIPRGGTSVASALKVAIKTFAQKERKYKVLVLLTDGEDHEGNVLDIARAARKEGIVIYTIGIGKPEGEVIPIRNENGDLVDYQKDSDGAVITTKLDEEILKKIALETGGRYYHATAGGLEIERIIEGINDMEKKDLSSRLLSQFENRYQFFLLLAVLLLFAEFFIVEEGNPVKSLMKGRV